jgi:hypothetical protein
VFLGGEQALIRIEINPARVQQVIFVPESRFEEDFDLAAWPIIRPFVDKIDRALKRAARQALKELRGQGSCEGASAYRPAGPERRGAEV